MTMATSATADTVEPRPGRLLLGILAVALAAGVIVGVFWSLSQNEAGPDNLSVISWQTRTETMERDYASVLEDRVVVHHRSQQATDEPRGRVSARGTP
jgi:hypothetical protein